MKCAKYLKYFFNDYIFEKIPSGLIDKAKVAVLLEKLTHDGDCLEISQFVDAYHKYNAGYHENKI